jgi:hypothetical protein
MRQLVTSLLGAWIAVCWFGGCSSSDSSGGSGGGSAAGAAGTNGQPDCNIVECFRAYTCVQQCGGAVVRSSCCACEPPLIDSLDCQGDAPVGDGSGGASGGTCEPGTSSTGTCQTLASVCTSTDSCCKCIDFPQAPSCGLQWSCALPNDNSPDCPTDAPSEGSGCTALKITCQYCTTRGPRHMRCSGADASGAWSEVAGLSCAN